MASEVQAGPDPAPPKEGLTLSQIREIAAEVGIEPERVSRAAALLPSADDSLVSRLIGGQPRHRLENSVPGLVNHDIAAAMERIAPRDGRYVHEETWHDDNGHSHVRATTVGPSLALPVVNGAIPLGTWQQIVFLDFDTRPRKRTVHVSVLGV
jgi:hypothetical protein